MKFSHNNKGFTLIELLVVVAIISILTATVLASLSSARSKARDAQRLAEIRQVRTALELYSSENGKYPQIEGISDGVLFPLSGLQATLAPFIKSIPVDPLNGFNTYFYVRGSDTTYGITVRLEREGSYCSSGTNVDDSWWGSYGTPLPLCGF